MHYYSNTGGHIYTGDMLPGDRLATDAEVAASNSAILATQARAVRDSLLVIADRLINTIEDVGEKAIDLRTWRASLRDWPATMGFPDISTIPSIPEGTVIPEDVQGLLDQLLGN